MFLPSASTTRSNRIGGCRVCMVEVTKADWNGWSDMVTSCLYPVVEGLIVQTHSTQVIELRKTIIDLMLARNPHTPLIQQLAADYGINSTSFQPVPEPNDCILCGICTRICDTMGFDAISAVNRGHGKRSLRRWAKHRRVVSAVWPAR